VRKKRNITIIVLFLVAIISGISIIMKLRMKESPDRSYETTDKHANSKLSKLIAENGAHRDLGNVKEGTYPHVSFTITNLGEDETRILVRDLSRGGCTSVGSPKQKLAPGESTELEFIFETLGYGGSHTTRKILVHYDNPETSPLSLSVTARVLPVEVHQVPAGELLYNFFVLVDIRSEEDFTEEHISGAINVPYEKLDKWSLNMSKDLLIYLYSEDGIESDKVAIALREKGFSECYSMVGGLKEWKKQYGDRYLISGEQ
jgi:rhodanese-related sulfurtransferase